MSLLFMAHIGLDVLSCGLSCNEQIYIKHCWTVVGFTKFEFIYTLHQGLYCLSYFPSLIVTVLKFYTQFGKVSLALL